MYTTTVIAPRVTTSPAGMDVTTVAAPFKIAARVEWIYATIVLNGMRITRLGIHAKTVTRQSAAVVVICVRAIEID